MTGPLVGVRVVELAGLGPAQLGAMVLSDLGADVVRIDRVADVPAAPSDGACRELLERGRRSVALDLKHPAGVEAALRLIDHADVVIDPYRPGVVERLGIGPDEVHARAPGVVYARMTGWGQDGPLAQAAGHDLNYIALVGALEPMGEPGAPPPVPLNLVGDFGGGGMLLVCGVLAALLERERSGRGQVIDVAMVDGVATLLTSILQLQAQGRWEPGRGGNWVAGAAPWYRAYATRDGRHVTVGPLEGRFYGELLEQLGVEPERFPQWDRSRWPELAAELTACFAERDLAAWTQLLEGTDACFAPVLSVAEAAEHPHMAARGSYVRDHGVLQPAPAPRFSRTPGAIGRPPPWPGEQTEAVLADAGLDAAEIEALVRLRAAAQGPLAEPVLEAAALTRAPTRGTA